VTEVVRVLKILEFGRLQHDLPITQSISATFGPDIDLENGAAQQ
jgi:hypothetical protein